MSAKREISGKQEVTVSLTSFPAAIKYAGEAVKSILAGSVLPDRIVLYLTLSDFPDGRIPRELEDLSVRNPVFEVRDYYPDIRSYQKLVPALADFPEDVIVTVDDDIRYHRNMLRDLLHLHGRFPKAILAHRAKRVKIGEPYRKWKKYRWYSFVFKRWHAGFGNMQTGVAGVLYPPHSLRDDMLDPKMFTELAPTTDDVWFWAAAVAAGTRIVPVPFGHNKPRGLEKPRELTLKMINVKSGADRNACALEKILEKYPEIGRRVEEEKRRR